MKKIILLLFMGIGLVSLSACSNSKTNSSSNSNTKTDESVKKASEKSLKRAKEASEEKNTQESAKLASDESLKKATEESKQKAKNESVKKATAESKKKTKFITADEATQMVIAHYEKERANNSSYPEIDFAPSNRNVVLVEEKGKYWHIVGVSKPDEDHPDGMPYTAYGVDIKTGEILDSPIRFNGLDVVTEPAPTE